MLLIHLKQTPVQGPQQTAPLFYRIKWGLTLIGLFLSLLGGIGILPQAMAQEESQETGFDSLMDDVSYPPPVQEGLNTTQASTSLPKLPSPPPAPVKKKWWQPQARQRQTRSSAAAAEDAIVNVGPRETLASNDLLFRLPLPVQISDQALQPGFYLVKQPNKPVNGTRELFIYKENKRLGTVIVSSKNTEDAKSPVQAIDPKHPSPPIVAVEARVAEDQKSLTLVLKEGDKRFISEPLPTQTETRPELNF